jgi:hypothetical protein
MMTTMMTIELSIPEAIRSFGYTGPVCCDQAVHLFGYFSTFLSLESVTRLVCTRFTEGHHSAVGDRPLFEWFRVDTCSSDLPSDLCLASNRSWRQDNRLLASCVEVPLFPAICWVALFVFALFDF